MEIENESKMVVVYARRRVGYAGNFFLNFSHFEVPRKKEIYPWKNLRRESEKERKKFTRGEGISRKGRRVM